MTAIDDTELTPTLARLRVLLDARMCDWSGVGRYTTGLVRALAERDHLDLVVVYPANGCHPIDEGDHVALVPATRHPFSLAGSRELGRIVGEHALDVVHCLHFPTPSPQGDAPIVVTLHDLTPLLVDGVMTSPVKRYIYRKFNERAARIASAVVADSNFAAGEIASNLEAARNKMAVIPLAADDFAAGDLADPPEGVVPTSGRYVFSMGSTRAHKDLPTLCAAFQIVAEQFGDVWLLLAGVGDDAFLDEHLTGEARARARFTGRLDDAQLRWLFANAQAFAFPSYYEGFGLPPLEAMALGVPVVVADAASLPEVVGEAAARVPVGDAEAMAREIASIIGDPVRAGAMRAQGRERAAEFSWAEVARQTEAVYRRVFGAPHPPTDSRSDDDPEGADLT